jgi:CubicO group peptidase (beta-lactamase class C family)
MAPVGPGSGALVDSVMTSRPSRRNLLGGTLGLATVAATASLASVAQLATTAAAQPAPPAQLPAAAPAAAAGGPRADHILDLARGAMAQNNLRAVIVRVLVENQELVTAAFGESLPGVPATPDMHFRNGAVEISYVATALLQLVDDGTVGLDDPLSTVMPELADADRVTLRMLANMTAGYPDYVPNQQFQDTLYADPFRQWTPEELIRIGLSMPRVFPPGTNWDYSHTDYVILGLALERIADQPLDRLIQVGILDPLGLTGTRAFSTPEITPPVLHAYSSERRAALGIPPATRFYEESTFWNPSWTLARGSIQVSTIHDLAATAVAVGTGSLLSAASHEAQVSPSLLGFGSVLAGCPACHPLDEVYNYGLGVIRTGAWLVQNPMFAGYAAVEGYLPSRQIAVAVATTFGEKAFDDKGQYANTGQALFKAIGAYLAPESPPLLGGG